jgi:hypothetical protein
VESRRPAGNSNSHHAQMTPDQLHFRTMTTVALRRDSAKQRKKARNLIRHKLDLVARAVPIEDLPEADATETMQMVINRTNLLWRAAAAEVDRLKPGVAKEQTDQIKYELWRSYDEQGNSVLLLNPWVEEERKLRDELRRITEAAQKLGLGERRARVAEGQLQMLGEALRLACKSVGLDDEMRRSLGAALRTELSTIEGRLPEPQKVLTP